MLSLATLSREFADTLGVTAPNEPRLRNAASDLLQALSTVPPVPPSERQRRLLALVNAKFSVNADAIAFLYAQFAKLGFTFNYHEKLRIAEAFDRVDYTIFSNAVSTKGPFAQRRDLFNPASKQQTINVLHRELGTPTLIRKDSKPRNWSKEILEALFGGFVFLSFPESATHTYFAQSNESAYEPDFWRYLHSQASHLFSREKSLTYLRLPPGTSLDKLASAISHEFETLSNHGHLAIHFDHWGSSAWDAAADATLFAEKFRSKRIEAPYFQWRTIEKETRRAIPLASSGRYDFEIAHHGFHYKDSFVIGDDCVTDLVVLFQKNTVDETVLPCPACRSFEVQGNSYSSLGVRSWECRNLLCPDRTKFNRGKRYSFLQLLKQRAIEDEANRVAVSSVRAWSRDVQPSRMRGDILAMLIRHYSLTGDGILAVGAHPDAPMGRAIQYRSLSDYLSTHGDTSEIVATLEGPYFRRFAILPEIAPTEPDRVESTSHVTAMKGDSTHIMQWLTADSFDGAVTSPPYYNAKEYSQWDNIYCYLHDMFKNASGVYRCLKPGGYYLFNIFDYFDNERNIAFSAMGQKRMILSAYCVNMFKRLGFACEGNIVWDKGDIEGKRGFNGGNFSPYYQAPFNCWEHILIFRKAGHSVWLTRPFPEIFRHKPVLKMVRGENRHGHTAPFPEALPRLLLDRLPTGASILDPYAGSMTTGSAAARSGNAATCVEMNEGYFELGLVKLGFNDREPLLL